MGRPAGGSSGGRAAALLAACVLLSLHVTLAAPGPGREPGPGGGVKCKKGYYKRGTGNYKCSKCPPGTIQPGTGHTKCMQCALDRYSNDARTYCKKLPAGVKRKAPPPTPRPTRAPTPRPTKKAAPSAQERLRADSQTYQPTRGCKPDGDGGTLCGIPVGYKGSGRTGVYYLPKTYRQRALPVMIVLHGSGVNGNWMLQSLPFKEYADKHQVIMVAPDSKFNMYWVIPNKATSPFTHDFYHIEGCYSWFLRNSGARVDKTLVSIAGNSRAGMAAPALASRSYVLAATSAVIMHANALPEQIGWRPPVPILWSTGAKDPLYGPDVTRVNLMNFKSKKPQYTVYYRVWESSHGLNKAQEIDYIVKFAASKSFRGTPAPPLGTYR
jgi:hypothetical protein